MASNNYPIPGHEPRPAMGIGRHVEEDDVDLKRLAGALGMRLGETLREAAVRCIRERDQAIDERAEMEMAVDAATVELREADDALVEARTDIATYQETIATLEAQIMDLEQDLHHLRGQRAELAWLLAEVSSEANPEVA